MTRSARWASRFLSWTRRHERGRSPSRCDLTAPLFTAHNIDVGSGEHTIADVPLLREEFLPRAVCRSLDWVFPGAKKRYAIADLGALEGGYSVEFARMGFETMGLEGRRSNYEKCCYVSRRLDLPNLRFVFDDVHNIDAYGVFDATFCCGLLYHLADPASFLHTLGRTTRRMLVLQTHYAPPDGEVVPFELSALTTHEGRRGRWFTEWPEGTPEDQRHPWSALHNHRSFWLTRQHLLQAMADAGFTTLYEQFDFLADQVTDLYRERYSRSLFIGLR
jgi:hypothetical protein